MLRMLKTFLRTKKEERQRKIQEKLDHDQFMVSFKRIMRYYEWLQTHSHSNDDVEILYLIFEQENLPVTDRARKEIESLRSPKKIR
jgi:arginine repressor